LLQDTERHQAIQLQALRNNIAAGKASGAALAAKPVFDPLQAQMRTAGDPPNSLMELPITPLAAFDL